MCIIIQKYKYQVTLVPTQTQSGLDFCFQGIAKWPQTLKISNQNIKFFVTTFCKSDFFLSQSFQQIQLLATSFVNRNFYRAKVFSKFKISVLNSVILELHQLSKFQTTQWKVVQLLAVINLFQSTYVLAYVFYVCMAHPECDFASSTRTTWCVVHVKLPQVQRRIRKSTNYNNYFKKFMQLSQKFEKQLVATVGNYCATKSVADQHIQVRGMQQSLGDKLVYMLCFCSSNWRQTSPRCRQLMKNISILRKFCQKFQP
eukprot:TRINITY_DN17733_c0_g1_i7.p1 TRINITY_DN17733_c0_g1~~TRINITY_DN17733_c0_g1_i7.p1  ORF type:complete len:266 (-),score=6.57 TRINITY_DN17733_c0_g1_i7:178-948(-)